jgi:hypothetical protein
MATTLDAVRSDRRSPSEMVPPALVVGAENLTTAWCAVVRCELTWAVASTEPPGAAVVADSDSRIVSEGTGWYEEPGDEPGDEFGGGEVCGGGLVGGGLLGGGSLGVGEVVGLGSGVVVPPAVGEGSEANAVTGAAAVLRVRTVAVPRATNIGLVFDRGSTREPPRF